MGLKGLATWTMRCHTNIYNASHTLTAKQSIYLWGQWWSHNAPAVPQPTAGRGTLVSGSECYAAVHNKMEDWLNLLVGVGWIGSAMVRSPIIFTTTPSNPLSQTLHFFTLEAPNKSHDNTTVVKFYWFTRSGSLNFFFLKQHWCTAYNVHR